MLTALISLAICSYSMPVNEIWTVAVGFDEANLGAGVDIIPNTSLNTPAQIYITEEKSWIEYSPILKAQLSRDQFDFVIYHELGHLYLDHQRKYDEAEARAPGSGLPLRRAFVLESDQFATLMYLKFNRNWDEVEKLITIMLQRNPSGEGIPPAKEREAAIRQARQFFYSLPGK